MILIGLDGGQWLDSGLTEQDHSLRTPSYAAEHREQNARDGINSFKSLR